MTHSFCPSDAYGQNEQMREPQSSRQCHNRPQWRDERYASAVFRKNGTRTWNEVSKYSGVPLIPDRAPDTGRAWKFGGPTKSMWVSGARHKNQKRLAFENLSTNSCPDYGECNKEAANNEFEKQQMMSLEQRGSVVLSTPKGKRHTRLGSDVDIGRMTMTDKDVSKEQVWKYRNDQ